MAQNTARRCCGSRRNRHHPGALCGLVRDADPRRWCCSRCPSVVDGPPARLACETGEPIDDICVTPPLARRLRFSAAEAGFSKNDATSDLGETVDQFVNQHLEYLYAKSPGSSLQRPLRARHRYGTHSGSFSTGSVRWRKLTTYATAATNAAEEDVLRDTSLT